MASTFRSYIVDDSIDAILKSHVQMYISKYMTNSAGKVVGIPVVQFDRYSEERAFYIEYIANKSELYTCSYSYYSLLEIGMPVLICDENSGYLDLDETDYNSEFLTLVIPYLNNDLQIELMPESEVETEGKMYPLENGYFHINPVVTYNPYVKRLIFEKDSTRVDLQYGGYKEQLFNCKEIVIEERFDTIKHEF